MKTFFRQIKLRFAKLFLDIIVPKGSIAAKGKLFRSRDGMYHHAPDGKKFSVMDREGRVGLRDINK